MWPATTLSVGARARRFFANTVLSLNPTIAYVVSRRSATLVATLRHLRKTCACTPTIQGKAQIRPCSQPRRAHVLGTAGGISSEVWRARQHSWGSGPSFLRRTRTPHAAMFVPHSFAPTQNATESPRSARTSLIPARASPSHQAFQEVRNFLQRIISWLILLFH
jgi:hypothetical protein